MVTFLTILPAVLESLEMERWVLEAQIVLVPLHTVALVLVRQEKPAMVRYYAGQIRIAFEELRRMTNCTKSSAFVTLTPVSSNHDLIRKVLFLQKASYRTFLDNHFLSNFSWEVEFPPVRRHLFPHQLEEVRLLANWFDQYCNTSSLCLRVLLAVRMERSYFCDHWFW